HGHGIAVVAPVAGPMETETCGPKRPVPERGVLTILARHEATIPEGVVTTVGPVSETGPQSCRPSKRLLLLQSIHLSVVRAVVQRAVCDRASAPRLPSRQRPHRLARRRFQRHYARGLAVHAALTHRQIQILSRDHRRAAAPALAEARFPYLFAGLDVEAQQLSAAVAEDVQPPAMDRRRATDEVLYRKLAHVLAGRRFQGVHRTVVTGTDVDDTVVHRGRTHHVVGMLAGQHLLPDDLAVLRVPAVEGA